MIEIREVKTKKEKKAFIDFPHDLYAGDPNYVPELHIAQQDMLNPKKYPFFEYGSVKLYLAYKDGKIAGRIASIRNDRYNKHFGSNIGFFGFFDTINDIEVARVLIEQTRKDARMHGFISIMGPTNLTTNETAGVLIDGFDDPPKIMMTYNKPYYDLLLTGLDMHKEMDLYAYMIYTDRVSQKSIRLAEALEQRLERRGITLRNINLKKLKSEAEHILDIYNEAWIDNWGFYPFTKAEFDYLRNDLKMIADEKFIWFAEKDGEPIGFGLVVPNINEVQQKIKRGRLFPTGIFKLLTGKSKVKTVRILALGVKKEYRKLGIEALFFSKAIKEAQRRKLIGGEASWVLENNAEMIAAAERLNGERYKTYRLYSCPV